MRLKNIFIILLLATLLVSSISLMPQEMETSVPAHSLSADDFSAGRIVDIDELREATKETFKLLDANNSGSITLDELDIMPKLIEGEEGFTLEEAVNLIERLNIVPRLFMRVEEELDHFEIADSDQDGTLSKNEFNLREVTMRTHILKLNLNSFDKDKNGGIELGEFSAHLDEVDELDTDGDGNLSRAEISESENASLFLNVREVNQHQRVESVRRDIEQIEQMRQQHQRLADQIYTKISQ